MIKPEVIETELLSNAKRGIEAQKSIVEIAKKFNVRKGDVEVIAYKVNLLPTEEFWGPFQRIQ